MHHLNPLIHSILRFYFSLSISTFHFSFPLLLILPLPLFILTHSFPPFPPSFPFHFNSSPIHFIPSPFHSPICNLPGPALQSCCAQHSPICKYHLKVEHVLSHCTISASKPVQKYQLIWQKLYGIFVLVILLQTVPLQSIMDELDECFILGKGIGSSIWKQATLSL